MHRIDQATAVVTQPTPAAAGTPGFFTNGNPTIGSPATVVDADWFNNVQEELMSIVAAASITPSKTVNNQVLNALQSILGGGIVGTMRNARMLVSAASASATFTADEIVVESALGGSSTKLSTYSGAINLATVGAGGMDISTAPVSGYVALYAIYGTSGTSILATNATSAAAPNVYAGGHMPTGYTQSALISVWPTNGSSQFVIGFQTDRQVFIVQQTALSTTTQQAYLTSLSISGIIPPNAKTILGTAGAAGTGGAASSLNMWVAGSSTAVGQNYIGGTFASFQSYINVPIITAQTIYYSITDASGTLASCNISISGYSI